MVLSQIWSKIRGELSRVIPLAEKEDRGGALYPFKVTFTYIVPKTGQSVDAVLTQR